ncbi:MAG: hypothetical protein Q4A56_01655 [Porphyromonadaceae bacterium]|nr:hypothetical protein [Porphyromonadaceae bacterium]
MADYSDIRKGLAELASSRTVTILGTATDIDEKERTCTVIDGSVPYYDVRLQCIAGGDKGIVVIPTNGSQVLMISVEGSDEYVIIMCEKADKVLIDADTEIVINGGTNGGLVKIKELTNKINALVDAFNNHIHQVSTAGSATAQTGTAAAVVTKAAKLNKSDYEDKKVKH